MKERLKKILPILGILCGACLVLAAVVLGEQVPKGIRSFNGKQSKIGS